MIDVFKEEFKKICRRKVVIIPFILVILINIFLSIQFRGASTFNREKEDQLYSKEIQQVLGVYDEEIHSSIMKELEKKKELIEFIQSNPSDKYLISEIEAEINVLNLINNQLNYVQENPDKRNVIVEAPWDKLIQEYTINPLPIILMIFISSYIFYLESPNEMYLLIESSINGRKKTNQSKLLLVFLAILILVLVPEFVKLIYAMPNSWLAPIQSHPFYSYATLNMNLLQTYLTIVLLKILGLSFISLVSVLITKITKNIIVTFITLVITFVAPYYILKIPIQRFWIPTNLMTPVWLLNFNKTFTNTAINASFTFIFVIGISTILLAAYLSNSKKII